MTGYLRWKVSAGNKRLVTTALTSPAPWPTSGATLSRLAARRRHLGRLDDTQAARQEANLHSGSG